ncbi:hypothetical protein HAX54_007160 [Datura stramonium]|uniref:Uncharacterized protein n=1 Tax=Datura stramonium TaxID=4076 RepID=A0ABS8TBG1_DATST|nr:hypothetical protein [Datura stramonium]
MTNDELKLVSCLDNFILDSSISTVLFIRRNIGEEETLNNVVISDDIGQGKRYERRTSFEEMRRNTRYFRQQDENASIEGEMWKNLEGSSLYLSALFAVNGFVADAALQYEVSHDSVLADWDQMSIDTFGTCHHFDWASRLLSLDDLPSRTLKEHIVDYDSDGRPALELVEWNIILTVDLQ